MISAQAPLLRAMSMGVSPSLSRVMRASYIVDNRMHAHIGKNMCVCLSFLCHPMMWQSSMLISLLVLSHEQIIITMWVTHDSFYQKPITLLEPLVVLIARHKDMLVEIFKQEGEGRCGGEGGGGQGERGLLKGVSMAKDVSM